MNRDKQIIEKLCEIVIHVGALDSDVYTIDSIINQLSSVTACNECKKLAGELAQIESTEKEELHECIPQANKMPIGVCCAICKKDMNKIESMPETEEIKVPNDEMIDAVFPSNLTALAKSLNIPMNLMSAEMGDALKGIQEGNLNKSIGAKWAIKEIKQLNQ